jgi:UDP-glucuronate 4-epimerase
MNNKKVLVTGAAGFIGYHLCRRLLEKGDEVTGLDNLNDYYDINLKLDRLKQFSMERNFTPVRLDLADREGMKRLFEGGGFDVVVNLAAHIR